MPSRLYDVLSTLSDHQYRGPEDFADSVIPRFATALGYAENHVYHRVALEPAYDLIPDAAIARTPEHRPHAVVDAQYDDAETRIDLARLDDYLDAANPNFSAAIKPSQLAVRGDATVDVDLQNVTAAEVDALADALAPPDALPDDPVVDRSGADLDRIETDRFTLDLDAYERLHDRVADPDGTPSGDALEDLAGLLFDGVTGATVTEQNLYSETAEIDLVVRHDGTDGYTFFDEYSRYALVECKNWEKPVGAKQVRDFIGKLRGAGASLGIFFAQNGVSGGTRGAYALGEIDMAFRNEGIAVVVIDGNDLAWIRNGNSFYDLLDRKLYSLRFRRKRVPDA